MAFLTRQDSCLFPRRNSLWDLWTQITGLELPVALAFWSERLGLAADESDDEAWTDILLLALQWYDPLSQWSLEKQQKGVFSSDLVARSFAKDDHFEDHVSILTRGDPADVVASMERLSIPGYAAVVHGVVSLRRGGWQKCLELAGRLEQRQAKTQPAAWVLYQWLFEFFATNRTLLDWPLGARSPQHSWTLQFQWHAGSLGRNCFIEGFEMLGENSRGSLLRDVCLFAVARMRQAAPYSELQNNSQLKRPNLTLEQRFTMNERVIQVHSGGDGINAADMIETENVPFAVEHPVGAEKQQPTAAQATENAINVDKYHEEEEALEMHEDVDDEGRDSPAEEEQAEEQFVDLDDGSDDEEQHSTSEEDQEEGILDIDVDMDHEENEAIAEEAGSSDAGEPEEIDIDEDADDSKQQNKTDDDGSSDSGDDNGDGMAIQVDHESGEPEEQGGSRIDSDSEQPMHQEDDGSDADVSEDAHEEIHALSVQPLPEDTDVNYYATAEESQEEDEGAQAHSQDEANLSPARNLSLAPEVRSPEERTIEAPVVPAQAQAMEKLDDGYMPEDEQHHTADEMPPPQRRRHHERDGYQGGESSIGHTEEDEEISEGGNEEEERAHLPEPTENGIIAPQLNSSALDSHSLSGMSAADERGPEEESSELEEANESDQVHFPPTHTDQTQVQARASLEDYAVAAAQQHEAPAADAEDDGTVMDETEDVVDHRQSETMGVANAESPDSNTAVADSPEQVLIDEDEDQSLQRVHVHAEEEDAKPTAVDDGMDAEAVAEEVEMDEEVDVGEHSVAAMAIDEAPVDSMETEKDLGDTPAAPSDEKDGLTAVAFKATPGEHPAEEDEAESSDNDSDQKSNDLVAVAQPETIEKAPSQRPPLPPRMTTRMATRRSARSRGHGESQEEEMSLGSKAAKDAESTGSRSSRRSSRLSAESEAIPPSPARKTRSKTATGASPAQSVRSRSTVAPSPVSSPARSARSRTTVASPSARSTPSKKTGLVVPSPGVNTRSSSKVAPSPGVNTRSRKGTSAASSPAVSTPNRKVASVASSPADSTRSRTTAQSPASTSTGVGSIRSSRRSTRANQRSTDPEKAEEGADSKESKRTTRKRRPTKGERKIDEPDEPAEDDSKAKSKPDTRTVPKTKDDTKIDDLESKAAPRRVTRRSAQQNDKEEAGSPGSRKRGSKKPPTPTTRKLRSRK